MKITFPYPDDLIIQKDICSRRDKDVGCRADKVGVADKHRDRGGRTRKRAGENHRADHHTCPSRKTFHRIHFLPPCFVYFTVCRLAESNTGRPTEPRAFVLFRPVWPAFLERTSFPGLLADDCPLPADSKNRHLKSDRWTWFCAPVLDSAFSSLRLCPRTPFPLS